MVDRFADGSCELIGAVLVMHANDEVAGRACAITPQAHDSASIWPAGVFQLYSDCVGVGGLHVHNIAHQRREQSARELRTGHDERMDDLFNKLSTGATARSREIREAGRQIVASWLAAPASCVPYIRPAPAAASDNESFGRLLAAMRCLNVALELHDEALQSQAVHVMRSQVSDASLPISAGTRMSLLRLMARSSITGEDLSLLAASLPMSPAPHLLLRAAAHHDEQQRLHLPELLRSSLDHAQCDGVGQLLREHAEHIMHAAEVNPQAALAALMECESVWRTHTGLPGALPRVGGELVMQLLHERDAATHAPQQRQLIGMALHTAFSEHDALNAGPVATVLEVLLTRFFDIALHARRILIEPLQHGDPPMYMSLRQWPGSERFQVRQAGAQPVTRIRALQHRMLLACERTENGWDGRCLVRFSPDLTPEVEAWLGCDYRGRALHVDAWEREGSEPTRVQLLAHDGSSENSSSTAKTAVAATVDAIVILTNDAQHLPVGCSHAAADRGSCEDATYPEMSLGTAVTCGRCGSLCVEWGWRHARNEALVDPARYRQLLQLQALLGGFPPSTVPADPVAEAQARAALGSGKRPLRNRQIRA